MRLSSLLAGPMGESMVVDEPRGLSNHPAFPLSNSGRQRPGRKTVAIMGTLFQGFYRQWLLPIMEPRSLEKLKVNSEKWQALDPSLQFPQQTAGVYNNSCGATHSLMERCNFGCSSCYLSDLANQTPALPFSKVKEQLDQLRQLLGPAGKVQLTSGEVTLLPVADLGKIVAYAKAIGLDPMVMTNGERLLQLPAYLPTLVRNYGLEKIAIHIDTTQKGRLGMSRDSSEKDIHSIRDQFSSLIKSVRALTRQKLQAAQTVTVTQDNFSQIPSIVRWQLEHLDSFRMISFQPSAEVGRTLDRSSAEISLDSIWQQICRATGTALNRHAMYFGHPECNIVAPLLVVSIGGQRNIIEAVRASKLWDLRFFRKTVRRFGGFTTVHSSRRTAFLKILSLLLRNPDLTLEAAFYGLYRLWGTRSWLLPFLQQVLTLGRIEIRPLAIVVHQFMSSKELATPTGQQRLEACVFRTPVDGRMISMCEMNATALRRELNRELQATQTGRSQTTGSGACTALSTH